MRYVLMCVRGPHPHGKSSSYYVIAQTRRVPIAYTFTGTTRTKLREVKKKRKKGSARMQIPMLWFHWNDDDLTPFHPHGSLFSVRSRVKLVCDEIIFPSLPLSDVWTSVITPLQTLRNEVIAKVFQ
jgi:hypothetical protein